MFCNLQSYKYNYTEHKQYKLKAIGRSKEFASYYQYLNSSDIPV